MLLWIQANFATVLICVVLAAFATAAVRKLIKNKKRGKGCGCAGCAMADKCHTKGEDK